MPAIGSMSFEEYLDKVRAFHGHAAPGMAVGGFMVDLAQRNLPPGEFFDAICETRACLPDAIQILTPCTIGNGWLKILDFGRFALTLYEKTQGLGVRVFVDPEKLPEWPEIKAWFFKEKSRKDQDLDLLLDEMRRAGSGFCGIREVRVAREFLGHHRRKGFAACPSCREAYPWEHGPLCRACQGDSPYEADGGGGIPERGLVSVPLAESVGMTCLHDMTRIVPGREKGPAFRKGDPITGGDLCRLQKMGRRHVYVAEGNEPGPDWVHEDDAALAFARAMAGEGVATSVAAREGKAELLAHADGLFLVDTDRLAAFNLVPGVACASRHGCTPVKKSDRLAGTRALPVFLHQSLFSRAMGVLAQGPLFSIREMKKARVGILVTGTEVFQGLVQDRFAPVIRDKVEALGCEVVGTEIVPDDRAAIAGAVNRLLAAGTELLVTTAGLSVDPDDLTAKGLADAGAADVLHGAPILPGNMTLLARIGEARVMGVPACALFHGRTSFDLLLPRVLAGVPITRQDLARMGEGSLCLECAACTFPRCGFGKGAL